MSFEFDPAPWLLAARYAVAFRESIGERPQRPTAGYAEMLAAFDEPTPENGAPSEFVIEDLVSKAGPGLNAAVGPRFFGWVIGASHPVGVAADWLTSAWGQNCGNHHASPAAAAAEQIAARWLLDLLDLPRESSVGFVTGATMASFVCLAAARSEVLRRAGWDLEVDGMIGAPPIRVVVGDEAHATIFFALQMLGFGQGHIRRVATDDQGRMLPAAFVDALAESEAPTIAIAQAGQINTGAFDPFAEIAAATRGRNAWLHIDGAFGLWGRLSPAISHLLKGVEAADSWATDGHKWLQAPYDCGYAIVRNPATHRRTMTAAASYLPTEGSGERDPSHYVPELSRRARGFATWSMIKHLGRDGLADMVQRHCALARRFAAALAREPGVFVLNEVVLDQIVVQFGASEDAAENDDDTRAVIAQVQSDGICFAGGVQWRGRWAMRLSVISWPTSEQDIDRASEAIVSAWRTCRTQRGRR